MVQRHVLGLIDRRIERQDGEIVFSDHSAKPGLYASADLRRVYRWDGKKLTRQTLDTVRKPAQNSGDS